MLPLVTIARCHRRLEHDGGPSTAASGADATAGVLPALDDRAELLRDI
jgi:hypothetical protein